MQAMLRFSLPEEEEQFRDATNGTMYATMLWETAQMFRAYLKNYEGFSDEQMVVVEAMSKEFFSIADGSDAVV